MNDYHSNVTSYGYDTLNRLTSLTAPGNKTWSYDYNDIGQRTEATWPNGMGVSYDYDPRNRLEYITLRDTAITGNAIEQYQYVLDEAGNIDEIQHLDGSYWDYDYEGRATAAVCHLNPVPLRTLLCLESGLINRKDRKEHKKRRLETWRSGKWRGRETRPQRGWRLCGDVWL